MKKIRPKPISPLAGDVNAWREKTKKLIDRSNPTTIQAVLVLLLELDKQKKLREFYKNQAATE